MNTQAIVPGSLSQVAQQSGKSLAESFIMAEVMCLVDVSGSMDSRDSRGGNSRFATACDELAKLQAGRPGKIAVAAFSSSTQFAPGGVPVFQGGGTNMADALKFAKTADVGGMRFVIISDGEPNSREETLAAARLIQGKIDVVYVGPDGGEGRRFLEQLAKAGRGQFVTADRAIELAERVETLLLR